VSADERPNAPREGLFSRVLVGTKDALPLVMELKTFNPRELDVVLRALRNVALSNDRFTDAERALVEGVARIHDVELDADRLEPITSEEVARIVVDPHRRKRVVQLAIVTALIEGTPAPRTERAVRDLAAALGLDEEGLSVLHELTSGHALLARFAMFRRVRRFIGNVRGFPGMLKLALPMLGVTGDEQLAASYRALKSCAPGTLGRAFHDHFAENHFKFPGEPGGIPLIFHDLGHVLAGYGTDPQSEIQQAAFQAGFARRDGFAVLLFGILQFHLGMRITPVAKGHSGLFDVPLVLVALHRGACCKVDLSQGYDVFANKDRPLDEVRAELGIPTLAIAEREVPRPPKVQAA
jgi:tellurite resistance protein